MKYLLSRANRPILEQLGKERTLCAFDFDGTLAPIVADPAKAAMRPETKNLLIQLADRYPCILLSGRARADAVGRLDGVGMRRVIGNHGDETEEPRARQLGEQWKKAIELRLPAERGLWVEDKGHSVAVHYRDAERKDATRRRIVSIARGLAGARIFGGKAVVNIVEAKAANKGTALAFERDRLGCDWVLYVGDDENDEDAFSLPGNVVSVRVGRRKNSSARFYIRRQAEIDRLLQILVDARNAPNV